MTTKTILVVEDDPLVRSYVTAVLQGAAMDCVEASTGGEALRMLESSSAAPRLLLLDLTLPDIPGIEVAARAVAALPGLPIIAMSGHAIDALSDAMSRGIVAEFLRKPFLPDQLLGAAQRLLTGDAPQRPSVI